MSTRSENDALGCTCHISRSTITPPSWRARTSTTVGTGTAASKRNSHPTLIRTSPPSCGFGTSAPLHGTEQLFVLLLAQGARRKTTARGSRSHSQASTASCRISCVGRLFPAPRAARRPSPEHGRPLYPPCHWPPVQDRRPPHRQAFRKSRANSSTLPGGGSHRQTRFRDRACRSQRAGSALLCRPMQGSHPRRHFPAVGEQEGSDPRTASDAD